MKVYLLNPPYYPHFGRSMRWQDTGRGGTLYYPIWIAYATGVVELNHQARLVDAPAWEWTLDDVSLNGGARAHIEAVLAMIRHREKLFGDWGLGETNPEGRAMALNFYGPPGTGKSMTAEALAGSLGKQLLLVSYAELESKYVGETPKNIRAVFQTASQQILREILDLP